MKNVMYLLRVCLTNTILVAIAFLGNGGRFPHKNLTNENLPSKRAYLGETDPYRIEVLKTDIIRKITDHLTFYYLIHKYDGLQPGVSCRRLV
jgi:hypothetical protein